MQRKEMLKEIAAHWLHEEWQMSEYVEYAEFIENFVPHLDEMLILHPAITTVEEAEELFESLGSVAGMNLPTDWQKIAFANSIVLNEISPL